MITVQPVLSENPSAQHQRWRTQGLRPIQVWVPDVRTPGFQEQAHQQSQAVAASGFASDDQAFIDAVSALDFSDNAQ